MVEFNEEEVMKSLLREPVQALREFTETLN